MVEKKKRQEELKALFASNLLKRVLEEKKRIEREDFERKMNLFKGALLAQVLEKKLEIEKQRIKELFAEALIARVQ